MEETKVQDSIKYYRLISYKEGKPFGIVKDFYISGKLQFTGKLIADYPKEILDSTCNFYWSNGNLKSIENYNKGILNGKASQFYEDGNIKSETNFLNGAWHGKRRFWNNTGLLVQDVEFRNNKLQIPSNPNKIINGKREGLWTVLIDYSKNEKGVWGNYEITDTTKADYFRILTYANDKPFGIVNNYYIKTGVLAWTGKLISINPDIIDGIEKRYYENGNIISEINFENGKEKINGIYKTYNNNGKIESEGNFINGTGIEKWYFEDGVTVSIIIPRKNGFDNGVMQEYYESGKIKKETNYINDKEEGKSKEYFENGVLNIESDYINGKKQGVRKIYYKNGKIKYETPYVDGNILGTEKIYNEMGVLIQTKEFTKPQI